MKTLVRDLLIIIIVVIIMMFWQEGELIGKKETRA